MAKYDGLIIPRSYSDYLNKTDGATLSQMLDSLGGTLDAAPTANSAKAARSGGIFASNAVITSDNATLTGVAISAGSVVRVLFTAALTGSNATTGLTLTYNGSAYTVKVGKNGALANFNAYEVESGVFKYLQAYTTLELMFDGTQFIIIGNPVVLSSADYTIYPDGSITYSQLFTKWSINTHQVTAGATISNLAPYGYDYEVLVYEKQRRITYKGIHKFNGGDIELGCYGTQFGSVDNSYVLLRDDAILYISESVVGNITFAIRRIAD